MTQINNILRPRPCSTVEGRTTLGPWASFDEALDLVPYGEDTTASDEPMRILPKFPELEPEPTTPSDNFSSVPFSAMIQSVLQQLDLEEDEDGSTVAAAAAAAAAAETPPLPFQPRQTPVKIIHSSSSGDSKLLPMCEEEGWVLGLPFQPRKTPVKIIHSTKLSPMDVEEGWVLPQPSKTRFRPVKRSGSGSTGTGRFSYLKPRKIDFAETVA